MKPEDITKLKKSKWLELGGKLVTRILKDADKGISQDSNGKDFPKYKASYAVKKAKEFKNYQVSYKTRSGKAVNFIAKKRPKALRGVSLNKQVNPPNLLLTGVMRNSLKTQKATNSSVELNYRDGVKFEGNAKRGRNMYGLNDNNFEFVKKFISDEIDERIVKFSKKDIVIDLKI